LCLSIKSIKGTYNVSNVFKQSRHNFFKISFSYFVFCILTDSSFLEKGVVEYVFPNSTFISRYNSLKSSTCSKLNLRTNQATEIEHFDPVYVDSVLRDPHQTNQYPLVILNFKELNKVQTDYVEENSIILQIRWDVYTFITCGEPRKETLNFYSLFSPFEKLTWILILITTFAWPLLLSLIEHNFCLKSVAKDFDALFIGLAILLEQSHLRSTNYTGRKSLYFYCASAMLTFLVLCNAYRGDNIKTLTKSFEILPFKKLSHLISSSYTMYTMTIRFYNLDSLAIYFILENKVTQIHVHNELPFEAEQYKLLVSQDQFNAWNSSFKPHKDGSDAATGDVSQEVPFMDLSWYSKEWKRKDAGFEVIKNCTNIALCGWKSDLLLIKKELGKGKTNKSKIFIGEEYLFKTYSGMQIFSYGYQKYRQHIWTLFESGVYNLLVNASNKASIPIQSEPIAINLKGNIIIQFILLSIGLAGSALLFLCETSGFTPILKPLGEVKKTVKLFLEHVFSFYFSSHGSKIVKYAVVYFNKLIIKICNRLLRSLGV